MSEKRKWEKEDEAEEREWSREGGVREGDDRVLVESTLLSEEVRRGLAQVSVTYSVTTALDRVYRDKPEFQPACTTLLALYVIVLSVRFWRKASQNMDTWQSDAVGHGTGLILALLGYWL